MPKVKDTPRYLAAGFTALIILVSFFYFAPFAVLAGAALLFMSMVAFIIGFIIIDTYDRWREYNDKNKGGKKASSSKDVG